MATAADITDALADIGDHFAAERLARHAPRMLGLLRGLTAKDPEARDYASGIPYCHHCEGEDGHKPDCPYVAAKAFLAEVGAGR